MKVELKSDNKDKINNLIDELNEKTKTLLKKLLTVTSLILLVKK